MTVDIMISNGKEAYIPPLKEGIQLDLERKGSPGKLKFSFFNDGNIKAEEGNQVKLTVDGIDVFFGFLFSKKISSQDSSFVECTAYDQLRYLKNKDTYSYNNLTVGEVIKLIAEDFRLNIGELEDTGYKIPRREEQNKTLFDIIQNAIDETLQNTGKLYVFYDNVGKLTLKNIDSMKLDLLIDTSTAVGYEYNSSIDSNTYNQVKVVYKNTKDKTNDIFLVKSGESINKWGVLQLNESVETKESGTRKAEALLKYYNKVYKTITVKDAFGDVRVKAGSSMVVMLQFEDVKISNYMVAEKVTHTFKNDEHLMTLKLRGGLFNV
nr:MAG TPA: 43 kDa tail protein [Caudoviricetes sp.]